jgi:hypothetical protein
MVKDKLEVMTVHQTFDVGFLRSLYIRMDVDGDGMLSQDEVRENIE